jgi:hypothetical protein
VTLYPCTKMRTSCAEAAMTSRSRAANLLYDRFDALNHYMSRDVLAALKPQEGRRLELPCPMVARNAHVGDAVREIATGVVAVFRRQGDIRSAAVGSKEHGDHLGQLLKMRRRFRASGRTFPTIGQTVRGDRGCNSLWLRLFMLWHHMACKLRDFSSITGWSDLV